MLNECWAGREPVAGRPKGMEGTEKERLMSAISPFAIYDRPPPPGVPELDIDPFSRRYFDDPYPDQERMREAAPFVWIAPYAVGAVARHGVVRSVLTNWKTFSSARGVGMEDFEKHGRVRLKSLILEADPPEHDGARRALGSVLSPGVLRALRDRFMSEAQSLVDDLICRRTFDGVADLARAFPLRVFPHAIGLKEDRGADLLRHADAMFNSFGPRNELYQASMLGMDFSWIEELGQRHSLREDGLGMMVHHLADRGDISAEDAPKLVRSLLQAGLDTTINSLAASVHALACFPSEWAKLRANPGLARNAFEEAIRFQSPVQTFFRTATQDTEIEGVPVREGDKILMFLGAANRDPRMWENPDQYQITRKIIGHVGFGAGIHACVGQLLAKLEGEVMLTALAEKIRAIEIVGEPVRHYNNTVRGWERMPLQIAPA